MACTRPLKVCKAPGGGIAFDSKSGYGDLAFQLKCGGCIGCRLDRQRSWAIRCFHESQLHEHSSFITLTYSDDNLPDDHSVHVRHWQLFAKALRRHHGKFRFFHSGEYGEQTLRPHYHALLFGMDFHDRQLASTSSNQPIYHSPSLENIWGRGYTTVQDVTFASAKYVARYCIKKITGEEAEEHYIRSDGAHTWTVKPDYSTMSRRPGLGTAWIEKYWKEVYPIDNVVMDGHELPVPQFYDRWLEINQPAMYRRVRAQRNKRYNTDKVKRENEEDRLKVRETVKQQRANTLASRI